MAPHKIGQFCLGLILKHDPTKSCILTGLRMTPTNTDWWGPPSVRGALLTGAQGSDSQPNVGRPSTALGPSGSQTPTQRYVQRKLKN